jgi:aconitate hydratase
VDYSRSGDSAQKNEELEYERNVERFTFLKWGANAFSNMLIVPPGSGIVHQEPISLFKNIFSSKNLAYF